MGIKDTKKEEYFSAYDRPSLTSGQFAKICNTTKATLIHYEDTGILVPSSREDNNYRLYSPQQFYDFLMIKTLSSAGASITEIQDVKDDLHTGSYHDAMVIYEKKLEKSIRELERKKNILNETIRLSELAASVEVGVPRVVYCEEELYTASVISDYSNPENHVAAIGHMMDNCKRYDLEVSIHMGAMVPKEHLLNKDIRPQYYYTTVHENQGVPVIKVKPAGYYIKYYHKGWYDTLDTAYERIFGFIEDHNFSIISDSFELCLTSYFCECDYSEFITEIAIQIDL